MAFPNWKRCVLGAYYAATLPARQRAARERAVAGAEPVRVLFYHRVADEYPNDWTISTAAFAAQIRWLHAHFELVHLAEAQQRIASGRNHVPTVCITFDDGYADNMRFAVPLLFERNIPFTYFVSTNHVLRNRPFPHDVAAGQPLAANTIQHVRELAAAGAAIGAHTRSHVDLCAVQCASQMADEIVGCKHELEQEIGQAVRYFAFPFGQHDNLSRVAFRLAYQAGYDGVCSAYGGFNFPNDDPFHIRRIHADGELIRFKNWLNVDSRKLRLQRDFVPGDYRVPQEAALASYFDSSLSARGWRENYAAAEEALTSILPHTAS